MTMTAKKFLAFMQFQAEDSRQLPAIRRELDRSLPKILDAFYEYMWSQPPLQEILQSRDNFSRLKDAQKSHWSRLFADQLPDNYSELAKIIGETHSRIGLTPDWYMGGYTFILNQLTTAFIASHGKKAAPMLATVNKLLMLDMYFSLEAYETSEAAKTALVKARKDAVENVHIVADFAKHTNDAMVTLAELTRDAQEVEHRSQSIASATEELVASVSTISENSDGAATEAQSAETSVKQGIDTVNASINAMERIAATVQASSEKVQSLAEASEQIAEILSSVEAIANQTNLLALNATIEAARAGEAGKGFAVVASEVKNLANQTTKATEDISARITTLKTEMAAITQTMEESLEAVTGGRENIRQSGEEMQTVATQVASVSHKMEEISVILQQQTEATQEISTGVVSIAKLAQNNNALTGIVSNTIDKSNGVIGEKVNVWAEVGTSRALCEVAKIDHLIFKKRVVGAVMNNEDFKVVDHNNCRLGKWYNSIQEEAVKGQPAYGALLDPHAKVHKCGHDAIEKARHGDMDGALQCIKELDAASQDVLRLLDELAQTLEY